MRRRWRINSVSRPIALPYWALSIPGGEARRFPILSSVTTRRFTEVLIISSATALSSIFGLLKSRAVVRKLNENRYWRSSGSSNTPILLYRLLEGSRAFLYRFGFAGPLDVGDGASISFILLLISSFAIQRPRINTPATFEAPEISFSGFSSTRTRSEYLPTSIVPALSISPRYSKGVVVDVRRAS